MQKIDKKDKQLHLLAIMLKTKFSTVFDAFKFLDQSSKGWLSANDWVHAIKLLG